MRKTLQILSVGIICVACNNSSTTHTPPASPTHSHGGYLSKDSSRLDSIKKVVRLNMGAYNPSDYYLNKHVALIYTVDHGSIQAPVDSTGSIIRKGRIPRGIPTGTFEIIYKDANGAELGKSSISSPLYRRVESGHNSGVYRIANGKFEILVPYERKVATITLIDDTERPVVNITSNVEVIFRNLPP